MCQTNGGRNRVRTALARLVVVGKLLLGLVMTVESGNVNLPTERDAQSCSCRRHPK
jgi:hypothetical protein